MASQGRPVPTPNQYRGSENGTHGPGTSRIRSRVACRGCNHRKVRCDVTRTGIPCSNCLHAYEAATCEVLPRKKHRPRRGRRTLQSSAPTTPHGHNNEEFVQVAVTTRPAGQNNPAARKAVDSVRVEADHDIRISAAQPTLENNPANLGADSPRGLPTFIDDGDVLPDDNSLSYIGDRRGPRFYVYDLCYPDAPQDAMPYLLPRMSDISWKPHEIEYLRHQGAFTTLPDDVCDDLIRCYFHHVHFFLPIVDATSFLGEYDNNGRQNISLLLFWSMLLAAANFVEADVLQKAGFASRKAMKTSFYERAKCLYDLDHGTEKLVLIQSVILMGFWYTDQQDHTGAWYWIGIAITLSQTLGLHRYPQLNNRSQRLPQAQQPLIRRIWWSCVVRDRWLSLAKGRPTRIHHEDCDVPWPGPDDILNDLDTVPMQTRDKFLPPDLEKLATMWVNLVKISDSLGKILRIHYRVTGPKPAVEDINNSAEELRNCKPREPLGDDAGKLLLLHAYHIELFYEATVAVLYRPYVLSCPTPSSLKTQGPWQIIALDKARAAASNTNSVLEKIIELNTVHLLKPMIITTLIPAMQIHLFDCKSTVLLRRGLGSNKLSLCMLVLSQLRDTYWSASVIYRLFERAQLMLTKPSSGFRTQAEKQKTSSSGFGIHTNDRDDTEDQQQHHDQDRQQQQDNLGESVRLMPESSLLGAENLMPGTFWLNDSGSPCFSTIDQLLSPGFSISENTFQSFFPDYDSNGVVDIHGQMMHASENVPVDLLYNIDPAVSFDASQ